MYSYDARLDILTRKSWHYILLILHLEMWSTDPQTANDAAAKSATKADNSDSVGSEPPLNEDDDDEDDDDEDNSQGDEEPKTNNLVLAQFDKVCD